MGEVFLAEDTRLGRKVALKFLPPELSRDPDAKARFVHEARAASALDHPNICSVYDIGEDAEGRMFMVMPHYEGATLKAIMDQGGITEAIPAGASVGARRAVPLPVHDAIVIAAQIAEGLVAAHARGIVHRDIKPANIFITKNNTVKILDFGIAKLAGSKTKLTKTGSTVGTVAYMSPEQAMGREVDARTDIWSLGVILYEMLAGALPFRGDYEQAVVYSVLNEEPEPLVKARSDIPSGLGQIIGLALAKDPAKRYLSIEEFLGDLQAVAEGFKPLKASFKPAKRKIFGLRKIYLGSGLVVLAAILLGLNIGGVRNLFLKKAEASVIRSLAVLPLANLSGDPAQEYFSDGMTEELIATLSKISTLKVISRTSVMQFKGSRKSIPEIAAVLGVQGIIEGSVLHARERVRITAQLINAATDTHLWAESYERDLRDVLAVQSEVAQDIAREIKIKLTPQEQARLANVRTVNPEAYDAYLKGLHHWYILMPADLDSAQQYFELALKKDPDYAQAYAGISFVWIGREQMGFTSPGEAGPKAKAAAMKALALDDNLAEAHYALACIRVWSDWDWAGAEPEFKRTIELNPNFPDARAFYSHLLNFLQRPTEALPQIERALELDPFNVLFQALYGTDLLYMRRFDDAIVQVRRALQIVPYHPVANTMLWWAYIAKGMDNEALDAVKVIYNNSAFGVREVAEALDRGNAEGGYRMAMRRAADALTVYSRTKHVNPTDVANLYIGAGDADSAIEWLEKGFAARDPNMPYIGLPYYDSLSAEPRFQALLRRMNFPSKEKK